MVRRARILSTVRIAAVGVALTLSSCGSVKEKVGGWLEPISPSQEAATASGVYYARVEGLTVYDEPSASSGVVGALALHEKVTRLKLERGYAYVQGSRSGVKGWVNNAELIWRLPAAAAPSEPAPSEARPEDASATGDEATTPEAAQAPASDPEPQPTSAPAPPAPPTTTPGDTPPSIFDAY
jgi:hypothetical protein